MCIRVLHGFHDPYLVTYPHLPVPAHLILIPDLLSTFDIYDYIVGYLLHC